MKSYSSRDIIKILKKNDWVLYSVRGDHHQFKSNIDGTKVTVPHPNKDLPLGTIKAIFRQAKIKL